MFRIINYALSFIVTKFTYPKAKVIQVPSYIRNFGRLKVGRKFSSGPHLIIDILHPKAVLIFGDNVKLYHRNHIAVMSSVRIGNDVLIASGVFITDHSHGHYSGPGPQSKPEEPPNSRTLYVKPVIVGDRVWIGENASVLPGATIGDGSIIGAGSVVLGSIPKNSIAVGSPARVVKRFCEAEQQWLKVTT